MELCEVESRADHRRPTRSMSYTKNCNDEELIAEARHRFLKLFNAVVWERYEHGLLSSKGVSLLNNATDYCHDDLTKKIELWDFCYKYFVNFKVLNFYQKMSKMWICGKYFKGLIVYHLVFIFDVTTAVLACIDELHHKSEDLKIHEEIKHVVLKEFNDANAQAVEHFHRLEHQFCPLIKFITTKRYAIRLINEQLAFTQEKYELGEIEDSEYQSIVKILDKKQRKLLDLVNVKWEPPSATGIVSTFPIFNLLTQ
mmetsp:Transcript_39491/g.35263  ORF Transcript_39491/g.35263 Transcript_39491/m.35263 type:complete len:255 (+) Transcript_39491:747-1511(+)